MMGAFAEAVEVFGEHGIAVIPTLPDRPSKPMVKLPEAFGVRGAKALVLNSRYRDANAAVVCGSRSGLTVVDIDSTDKAIVAEVLDRFGDTPLKAQSASGNWHLYYRHAGERRRIRALGKRLPVDVLGAGLAVVPPSHRAPTKTKRGGGYRFMDGTLEDLQRLRPMRHPVISNRPAATDLAPGQMRDGDGRNSALFDKARWIARQFEDEGRFLKRLFAENQCFGEPLAPTEVTKIAASVWGMKRDGRLLGDGDRVGFMSLEETKALSANPSALVLLSYLRSHHPSDHVFAVVPEAISKSGALLMSTNTIRAARQVLLDQDLLEFVAEGGRGPTGRQQPNQYRLITGSNIWRE